MKLPAGCGRVRGKRRNFGPVARPVETIEFPAAAERERRTIKTGARALAPSGGWRVRPDLYALFRPRARARGACVFRLAGAPESVKSNPRLPPAAAVFASSTGFSSARSERLGMRLDVV